MFFSVEGVLRALFLCTSQKLNFLSCLNPNRKVSHGSGREMSLRTSWKGGLKQEFGFLMSRVGYQTLTRLGEAEWGHRCSHCKCPCNKPLEFHEWGLGTAFCQWMDVFFSKGEKNVFDFSHLFVYLWQRGRNLWRKMIVGEYIYFCDKLAMPCFSGDSGTLSGI